MLFAATLSAAFLLLFRAAPHWLVFLLVGMVEVFVYVPAMALLNREIDSDRRIFATASHNYAFSAGFFLGPALGGLVIPIGGFGLMFAMLAAVLLGGAALVAVTSHGVSPTDGPGRS